MVEDKTSSTEFFVRCMKCGNEFIIKEGRTEQKKRRKIKKISKGITITPADEIKNGSDPIAKEQRRILKQMKQVKALNKISQQMKRPKNR